MDRSFDANGLVVVGTTCGDVPVQRNVQSEQYTSFYGTKQAKNGPNGLKIGPLGPLGPNGLGSKPSSHCVHMSIVIWCKLQYF